MWHRGTQSCYYESNNWFLKSWIISTSDLTLHFWYFIDAAAVKRNNSHIVRTMLVVQTRTCTGIHAHTTYYVHTHIHSETHLRWILLMGGGNLKRRICLCQRMSLSLFMPVHQSVCAHVPVHSWIPAITHLSLQYSQGCYFSTSRHTAEQFISFSTYKSFHFSLLIPQSHKPLCPCPRQQPPGSHSSPHIPPLFTQRRPLTATEPPSCRDFS